MDIDPVSKPLSRIKKWVLLIVLVVLANVAASYLFSGFTMLRADEVPDFHKSAGLIFLLLYALLLAIPFVPGVEIGVSLLMIQGPAAAPFVYAATVVGLLVSYGFGLAFSKRLPCSFLNTLGFIRACRFVDNMKDQSRAERLQSLQDILPAWVGSWVLARRYILIAVLLNLPGSSLIGGGGGIMLVAGLTRLFSLRGVALTIVLATAPVPLLVYFYGSSVFG